MADDSKDIKDPVTERDQDTPGEPHVDTQSADNESVDAEMDDRDQEGIEELKDKYLRLFAEFDNYKKRTVRERLELMRSASQDIMTAILPVLDDFDRAIVNAREKQADQDPVVEGLFLVYHKMQTLLQQKGLRAMDSTGLAFDPEMHEAVTEIPAPAEEQKGTVIDTLEKGYTLNDKIIRYAKVVVGK
jgi:molecular chaperone GrpE